MVLAVINCILSVKNHEKNQKTLSKSSGWVEIGQVSREDAVKATGNSEHGRTVE